MSETQIHDHDGKHNIDGKRALHDLGEWILLLFAAVNEAECRLDSRLRVEVLQKQVVNPVLDCENSPPKVENTILLVLASLSASSYYLIGSIRGYSLDGNSKSSVKMEVLKRREYSKFR